MELFLCFGGYSAMGKSEVILCPDEQLQIIREKSGVRRQESGVRRRGGRKKVLGEEIFLITN